MGSTTNCCIPTRFFRHTLVFFFGFFYTPFIALLLLSQMYVFLQKISKSFLLSTFCVGAICEFIYIHVYCAVPLDFEIEIGTRHDMLKMISREIKSENFKPFPKCPYSLLFTWKSEERKVSAFFSSASKKSILYWDSGKDNIVSLFFLLKSRF